MKKLLLMAIAIMISTGVFAQMTPTTETKTVKTEEKYYCPMHIDITSDKPGKCSKCGMDMLKTGMETVSKYCCPNCDWTIPPVKGQCANSTESVMKDGTLYCLYCHDKSGKCTKCGREMEKIQIRKEKAAKKG